MTSFFFVLVSITGFCLETLPEMTTMEEVTRRCDADDSPAETVLIEEPHPVLKYIDYICTAFFSVEFLVRVVFAPNKLLFFRSVMNMIDIAALLPLYLQVNTPWPDSGKIVLIPMADLVVLVLCRRNVVFVVIATEKRKVHTRARAHTKTRARICTNAHTHTYTHSNGST